jgi:hypothetical protein
MVHNIESATQAFPAEDSQDRGYWHLHVPVGQSFIDSFKTPHSIRQLCVQTLLDAADRLRGLRTDVCTSTRVVVAIDLPNLFDSQIIVFFGDHHYGTFFDRHTDEQQWNLLPADRSLAKEWGLRMPPGFLQRGYREHIANDDYVQHGEIWFIGELA